MTSENKAPAFVETVNQLVVLPGGTCCHRAAQYFLTKVLTLDLIADTIQIITVASFWEGKAKLEQMNTGIGTGMLVPDISEVNRLITESAGWNWEPKLSFPLPNPPLYLSQSKVPSYPQYRCATIPDFQPLLNNDLRFEKPENSQFYDVLTTQDAAIAVIEGNADYCITNEAAMIKSKGRLNPIFQLRHMTIFWKLFYYKLP